MISRASLLTEPPARLWPHLIAALARLVTGVLALSGEARRKALRRAEAELKELERFAAMILARFVQAFAVLQRLPRRPASPGLPPLRQTDACMTPGRAASGRPGAFTLPKSLAPYLVESEATTLPARECKSRAHRNQPVPDTASRFQRFLRRAAALHGVLINPDAFAQRLAVRMQRAPESILGTHLPFEPEALKAFADDLFLAPAPDVLPLAPPDG
jgi:hypothetical protein